MAALFSEFKRAQKIESGPLLAATITPVAPPQNPGLLRSFYNLSNPSDVSADIRFYLLQDRSTSVKLPKQEGKAWVEIFIALWKTVGEVLRAEDPAQKGSWANVFEAWKEVCNLLIRAYSSPGFAAWTVPCLYVAGKYLREFAIKADSENSQGDSMAFSDGLQEDVVGGYEKNAKLEDAARVINRIFTLCLSDRAPLEESRKWGIYNTTNLLFKTYFKLNSIGLSKNVLRALSSQSDLPPLEAFPKSHIVTFKYYVGVICFVDENYTEAEEHLTYAWRMCHKHAFKNKELILTYLIPCHLVTTHTLPTTKLLAPYPRLGGLFRPLSGCIKRGDLAGFDDAMSAGEDEFVKRRIYLPLERGRDIAVRNLFRRVYLAGGFDEPKEDQAPIRRTRIPVAEFAAAVRLGNKTEDRARLDFDEVECILSNLIYKNLMKGYIARERGIVVLSKGNTAFPGTNI